MPAFNKRRQAIAVNEYVHLPQLAWIVRIRYPCIPLNFCLLSFEQALYFGDLALKLLRSQLP